MVFLTRLLNLKFSRFSGHLRHYCNYKTKMYMKVASLDSKERVDHLIKKYAPKLIYNTIIERKLLQYEYQHRKLKPKQTESSEEPVPISLKFLSDEIVIKEEESSEEVNNNVMDDKPVNFPYGGAYTLEDIDEETVEHKDTDIASEASKEVQKRYEMKNWMVNYDNYDDTCLSADPEDVDDWKVNYGTPDPTSEISNIPCGGCGALLHCRDTAIPGYIPSEIFKNRIAKGGTNLEAIICQRCYFLKHYDLALQVQVTPEDYPKVLTTISKKRGLVILMVDLLDFPCSIWPGIGEIFGRRTPVVVVGNKVDLLPQDSKDFLKHIRTTLVNNIKLQGFATFNIKEVALISARTGYGIEDLITKLNTHNRLKGDVYIVGCTNVGKSSLFNAFLQSDFCKTQAIDLIQRATTSVWPGTTLNLLKFPIKRPAGFRQYLRHKRLEIMQSIEAEELRFRKEQLKNTKNAKYASLIGHIDVTRSPDFRKPESRDIFVQGTQNASGITVMGINENRKDFEFSKWCYDTPGVVQPDQITHLLTTDELLLTLPKEIILPRTFCIKPKSTIFIGGLARLDYMDGLGSVRLTVFASNELPITVCDLDDAEGVYQELLGTKLFKVPSGNAERLSKWPKLEMAKRFSIKGIKWYQSVNDVVLSSAGWIALTGKAGLQYHFQAWTPEKRGVYIRDCLLPHAVGLTGKRIKHSVAYNKYKFFLQ